MKENAIEKIFNLFFNFINKSENIKKRERLTFCMNCYHYLPETNECRHPSNTTYGIYVNKPLSNERIKYRILSPEEKNKDNDCGTFERLAFFDD